MTEMGSVAADLHSGQHDHSRPHIMRIRAEIVVQRGTRNTR